MLTAATSGYVKGSSAQDISATQSGPKTGYWSLEKLRRAFTDYRWSKREEIDEQVEARKYYHGVQHTDKQVRVLNERNQPVMTYNEVARKVNGVVGLIERLRQDPKAFPRTPKHEQGAELATATMRYVLDSQDWASKSPEVARDGAIDGIGGVEILLAEGDHGDRDIELDTVDPSTFFYDPRSFRPDFSDARYQGTSKWIDFDLASEMFPDKAEELEDSVSRDTDLTTDSDRDAKWIFSDGNQKRIRLVDCWYKHKGEWCYAVHTGTVILMEGQSYLRDEKHKTMCKYIMFRSTVDHDGDAYGFHRNLKSGQDGLNAKHSKLMHILASRRLIMTSGAVADVEKVRKEWARPDGVVVANPGGEIKPDDQAFDFTGWVKLLELDQAHIDNFGPNPALIGSGMENQSGRAINLLQQAGIAELGPYILAFKGWKLRVYRAVWNAVQHNWTGERWVRVTDNQDVEQFIQVNGLGIDPNTGMPTIVNQIGSLDVDILIDEGPDYVNMQADSYDTLSVLASKGANIPPRVLIELSPLDYTTKKKITGIMDEAEKQPNPEVAAKQAELQFKQQDMQMSAQMKAQEAQAGLQLKAADSQQNAALEQQKAEQQMMLKREELAANIELKRIEAESDIAIEREKANNAMMIAQQKAEQEQRITELQAVNEDTSRNGMTESKNEVGEELISKMDELSEAIQQTIKLVGAPRRYELIRDPKTNRPVGSRQTIEMEK